MMERLQAIHIQYFWYPRYRIFGRAIFKPVSFYICSLLGFENSQCIGNMPVTG